MKKVMILVNIVGIISTLISLFCNFVRGEGAFIFIFLAVPLWIEFFLSTKSISYISKFEREKFKKQILWILIVNSIITLTYYGMAFLFEKATILLFATFISIAFFSNITLMIMILFSRKLFRIVYSVFIMLFITSFVIQMMIFHANRYEFKLNNEGTSYILQYNYIEGISITIPSTYNDLPITVIDGALSSHIRYWQNIRVINFEKDSQLVLINDYAFAGSEAKKVHLPNSVQIINYCAFASSHIEEMIIPNGVNYIGEHAFRDCKQLKKVVIPKNVITLEEAIFENCENITIYCEAESKPSEWSDNWASGITNPHIVWGYDG